MPIPMNAVTSGRPDSCGNVIMPVRGVLAYRMRWHPRKPDHQQSKSQSHLFLFADHVSGLESAFVTDCNHVDRLTTPRFTHGSSKRMSVAR